LPMLALVVYVMVLFRPSIIVAAMDFRPVKVPSPGHEPFETIRVKIQELTPFRKSPSNYLCRVLSGKPGSGQVRVGPSMLPCHVDGGFHIVCQDDELRGPARGAGNALFVLRLGQAR
jgi:hypothetical protein